MPRGPLFVFALGALLAACGLGTAGLKDTDAGAPPASVDAGLDATISHDAGDTVDAPVDDDVATQPDTAPPADVEAGPPVDAGPCLGVACNGGCLADASDCRGCTGSPLFCAATRACGASCAGCGGNRIECFDCDSNRQNPVGTCQPFDAGSYCIMGSNYPNLHCGCANKNDPTPCPGETQVCGDIAPFTIACMTCGEPGTDGLACRGGGACSQDEATCQ
jgi:hypothetical protein